MLGSPPVGKLPCIVRTSWVPSARPPELLRWKLTPTQKNPPPRFGANACNCSAYAKMIGSSDLLVLSREYGNMLSGD